jgi:hypothetical protein
VSQDRDAQRKIAQAIHKVEQAAAFMRDQLAPVLGGYFLACMKSGFTREEALWLVRDYQLAILHGMDQVDGTKQPPTRTEPPHG